MMTFAARRWLTLSASGLIAAAIVVYLLSLNLALQRAAYVSGWMLAGMVLFLAAYNVRKKLTYPPLLKSAWWLQLHIYIGLLSIVVYAMHAGFDSPDGVLEFTLAAFFLATAGSGVIGLALSRMIPARLTQRGQEVVFERIPIYIRELRDEAEQLVVESVKENDATTIADFHASRLARFFAGPRHCCSHLIQSTRPLRTLLDELRALDRYCNEQERKVTAQLEQLIRAKDDLDYHYAHQALLKGWLFVHIPLTYGLLLVAAAHVLLAYAFDGGLR